MFGQFHPRDPLIYEHMFCSTRTSAFAQRARDALSLTRAFLLLEDDDPVNWEVGQEEYAEAGHEPAWAHAHRAPLCGQWTLRRGGQAAPSPQPCLSPTQPSGLCARPTATQRGGTAPRCNSVLQRGSRITTGNSRAAIDL